MQRVSLKHSKTLLESASNRFQKPTNYKEFNKTQGIPITNKKLLDEEKEEIMKINKCISKGKRDLKTQDDAEIRWNYIAENISDKLDLLLDIENEIEKLEKLYKES